MEQPSAHPGLGRIGAGLEEIWLEIGGSCHLRCRYCFAESGGIKNGIGDIGLGRLLDLISEFKLMGGKRVGIVGAGEPFHPRNRKDLYEVLRADKDLNLNTAIFTSGDLIEDEIVRHLDGHTDIRILVKCNSLKPAVQDRLVGRPGYTLRRDEAMNLLIERGYNDGSRLGIVTSIMAENFMEMPDLLRYARRNNLIFDADTLLPRGRGYYCAQQVSDQTIRDVIAELQRVDRDEFGNEWPITGNYIASPPCTRFSNHLYLTKDGKAHPCVGSAGVELGDAKTKSLNEIWDSGLMKMIRAKNYAGKCTTCQHFIEAECHSCLGRACEDLNAETLKEMGNVQTKGCFNFKIA